MKCPDISFRDVEHKFCYISAGRAFASAASMLPGFTEATGVLAYGYVDHTAGLSFEILACAKMDRRGGISICEGNDLVSSKYRVQSISDCDVIPLDVPSLTSMFSERISAIEKYYTASPKVLKLRSISLLDPCRHPEYPDDLRVMLYRPGNTPESCWVRCESMGDGYLSGTLLNEPVSDFGVHQGEFIKFQYSTSRSGVLCSASFS